MSEEHEGHDEGEGYDDDDDEGWAAGIEKRLKWRCLFFIGALCTTAAGLIAVLSSIARPPRFSWGVPFSFLSELFLLVFGLLLVLLDVPIPHGEHFSRVWTVRGHVSDLLLFMTRFTGRGMWYCFQGTMIFAALWDTNESRTLGCILGGYVILLGFLSMATGLRLSLRLDELRRALQEVEHHGPGPGRYWTKEHLAEVAWTLAQESFSDDELDYIMNGLSLHASNDGVLSHEEYSVWLHPGGMAII